MGLDVTNRREVSETLKSVTSQNLTRVLLLLRPQDPMPGWITHILELNKDMTIKYNGSRNEWTGQQSIDKPQTVRKIKPPVTNSQPEIIVELRNVNVSYGGTQILKDVSWVIRKGERWVLTGDNGTKYLLIFSPYLFTWISKLGSGKSTLLSLILGDNQQAYSNHVSIFGKRRGEGITLVRTKTAFHSCLYLKATNFSKVGYKTKYIPLISRTPPLLPFNSIHIIPNSLNRLLHIPPHPNYNLSPAHSTHIPLHNTQRNAYNAPPVQTLVNRRTTVSPVHSGGGE